jgi:hypothetical protein
MDQVNRFDNLDPIFSPPPVSPPPVSPPLVSPPADASDALALPPLGTYPSKEALFEAIQSWSKPRGYTFTIGRTTRRKDRRQKVNYACDRYPPIRQQIQGLRKTQSRGIGCLFSIIAAETPTLEWEVRYRLK